MESRTTKRMGRRSWASLALCVWLAGCGGGDGTSGSPTAPLPPPQLQLNVHGPQQILAGESVLINGAVTANGAVPDSMSWTLLERPASSQAVLGESAGSSQQLRTDVPGRYVLQWTARTADGQTQSKQWTVDAVQGPVIQTSTDSGHLRQGQPTTLVAAMPSSSEAGPPASFRWRLLNAPAGSGARLSAEWGQEVQITADRPGDYQVEVESRQGSSVQRTVRTLPSMTTASRFVYIIRYCNNLVPDCGAPQGNITKLKAYVAELPDSAPASYRWSVVAAPSTSALAANTAEGKFYDFVPDVEGIFGIQLDVSLGGTLLGSQTQFFRVVQAPSGRIEGPATATVGQQVELDASANRGPDGRLLSNVYHGWRLVKAPVNSSAEIKAPGWADVTAKFRPDRPGDYVISLQVDTIRNYASFNLHVVSKIPGTVYPPKVTGNQGPLLPGEALQLRANSESDLGHPIVHTWKFGDGSTETGDSVSHSFAYPGIYEVQVTGTDSVTQRFARQLLTIKVVAERHDNIPPAPCTLPADCAATGPDTYAGQGLGRWQLINDRPHQQVVNLDIAGVPTGRRVMISLTNASASHGGTADLGQALPDRPDASSAFMGPTPFQSTQNYRVTLNQARDGMLRVRDELHAAHLERDRALAAAMEAARPRTGPAAGRRRLMSAAARAPAELPAIDSARTWMDTAFGGSHDARLGNTCELPGGRAVLFWLGDKALEGSLMSKEQVATDFMPVVCGEQGGFHRLQKLLDAEVFGPHERSYQIVDNPLQPIHLIFIDGGPYSGWGAYVHGVNHYKKAIFETSNEALVMMVNARFVKPDLNFVQSSLVHEFMHLVNIYQRTVLNYLGAHESWLEETTAMMAEDLLASELVRKADGTPYAPMAMRVSNYQSSWFTRTYLGGIADYSVGGSLAAFLDRRLGHQMLQGLTFDCDTTTVGVSSLRCLDDQVFKFNGKGLAESYAAMNLSLMAPVNSEESPGLGLPAFVSPDVKMPAIDLKPEGSTPRDGLLTPSELYAGSHVYRWETVQSAAGGHFRRKGIVVPPGHVLQVLIR